MKRAGFTLIEVLGAIFLTSVVIAVAVGFFLNLSDASTRAAESMRTGLAATAVLERVARDLSGATLLAKPDEVDPLAHPWFFAGVALGTSGGGADALKFISRSQRPTVGALHVSDLAQVAYFSTVEDDGSVTLFRWTAASLPESYDPEFPGPDAPGSFVLAEGLGGVSFRFRGEDGVWVDEWDSTQLERSGLLPSAVEITVFPEPLVDDDGAEFVEAEAPIFSRQVVLRQRPLDLVALIEEAVQRREGTLAANAPGAQPGEGVALDENGNPILPGPGAEDGGERKTVGDCVRANFDACVEMFGSGECTVWSNINTLPIGDFGGFIPPAWGCR